MICSPACDGVCLALEEHVRNFFDGYDVERITLDVEPIRSQNPHLRVLRAAPRPPRHRALSNCSR